MIKTGTSQLVSFSVPGGADGGFAKFPAEMLSDFCDSIMVNIREKEDPDFQIVRDKADVDAVLAGEGGRYEKIIKRYQNYISKILWRFSRDRQVHEELVHDTFVEAYMSLGGYKAQSPLSNWLATIATRQGYKHWREQSSQMAKPLPVEEWDLLADTSAAESLEPETVSEVLFRLLEQLPPRDRLVLTLRYIEGCSVEEAALRSGWSRAMVKVQTWRAKNKLLQLYNESIGGKDYEDRK
ncbi:Sigma-24 [Limihaloglobus sulfuriphilus]|uniref:Sigma-24 n=1 Tax=Limihaloglobus sulfuriphilus TaxID=1851148 RepID=A0A1Q2MCC3_9BACT|nr:RNA polymerase sigma factor [Limihaloglobus sulfuriphilus]AQQ70320.1 Sigma-24 [Limihaloglobus sulfuriphilus]